MEKKIYYEVVSNGDLSFTCSNLQTIAEMIEGDMLSEAEYDGPGVEGLKYTITVKLMTDEEYSQLPEMT